MNQKYLLLFGLLQLLILTGHAQNPIPNSSFEKWIHYGASLNWDDPQGWDTPNEVTVTFGKLTVVIDSDAVDSFVSAKLKTWGNPNDSTVVFPGLLCAGTVDPTNRGCIGGFLDTIRYLYFSGYYKYFPVDSSNDSCLLSATMWRWDAGSLSRDTVATADFHGGSQVSFTHFAIPFEFRNANDPDSAMIMLMTTKTPNSAPVKGSQGGSKLLVDAVSLSLSVGIGNIIKPTIQIFPNPVNGELHLEFPDDLSGELVRIYDYTGKTVKAIKVSNNKMDIDISHLPSGLYFVSLSQSSTLISLNKFIIEH